MRFETYSVIPGGAIRRIRTPHPHDVLGGRGGGINAHPGNKVFRDWVAERKEDYNLAPNKHEKTQVAIEVMDRVKKQNPPGRFLQRDPTSTSGPVWWVEVDDARALAKTSQALREGAPQIRLAHKEELQQRGVQVKRDTEKHKRKIPSSATENASQPQQTSPQNAFPTHAPPVPSSRPISRRVPTDEYNKAIEDLQAHVRQAKDLADREEKSEQQEKDVCQEQDMDPKSKRFRLNDDTVCRVSPAKKHEDGQLLDAFSETPPLLSVPTPPENYGRIHLLDLGVSKMSEDVLYQALNSPAPCTKSLQRVHSLALSDYSTSDTNVFDDDGQFINPFEDESGIAHKVLHNGQTSDAGNRLPSGNLRNVSSNEDCISEPHHVEEYPEHTSWEEERSSFPDLTSDENNHIFHGSWETDFDEGMKTILDVVHPDLTSPDNGDKLPTLLIPWTGNGVGTGICSNKSINVKGSIKNNPRTSIAARNQRRFEGRQ